MTGTTRQVRRAAVVTVPIDVAEHEALVADRAAGAVVSFGGVVRDHDQGRRVDRLDYEAHPSAAAVVGEIAADIARRHDVVAVAISHRTGPLEIGEVALAAAVSAAHRLDAFAACAELIDEVKARLPVWKHQHYADGTREWTGSA